MVQDVLAGAGAGSKREAAEIKLRGYGTDDLETLYAIDQACYPPGIAYSRRTLRWFLKQPGADCLVGEVQGVLTGFILTEHDGALGHIVTLDVLQDYRRRGFGSALLEAAERRLAGCRVRRADLETATENEAAVAFWLRHGYRTRGLLKGYYGRGQDAFAMSKSLE